jgi:DNA replication protein DnaC
MKTTTEQRSPDSVLDAFLATQPPDRDCKDHPGQKEQISRVLTRHRCASVTTDGGIAFYSAAYSPCPLCERDRLLDQCVPPALIHAAFNNFIPRTDAEIEHLAVVQEFAQARRGFLFLLGPVGIGKSHLAVAVMRTFSDALFVRQAQLLRQLRAHYHNDTIANPIAGAQKARLLVLDELGVSGGGRDELPMLDEILASRYEQQLPTIITSNLLWEDISAALGERLADRLNESCFRVLVFAGKSHRAQRRDSYFGAQKGNHDQK